MKKKDQRRVCTAIEADSFDHAFVHGSTFDEVKDPQFHVLREAYLAARQALAAHVGWEH